MGLNGKTAEPRVNVTRGQIAQLVAKFYAKVREPPVLGPVFFAIISRDDKLWRDPESKITDFWCNVLLNERRYVGNPMLVHTVISDLKPHHFAIWLGIFDQTLTQTLSVRDAPDWSFFAHCIGRGLRLGVDAARKRPYGPPNLRL